MKIKSYSQFALRKRLFISILTLFGFFILIIFGFNQITNSIQEEDRSAFIDYFLNFNQKIFSEIQSPTKLSVEKPVVKKKLRVNGLEGLRTQLDLAQYKIHITSGLQDFSLHLNEIKKWPQKEVFTEFKCIEGWSAAISYKGLAFSDFMDKFKIGKKSDGSYYKFVGLETPDGEYFVSIDMKSMIHPQTLLAFEMNQQPLSLENGAPVRLIIPIKYGVKSIKRIGRIYFSDEQPKDYWTEQGYDWFAGL